MKTTTVALALLLASCGPLERVELPRPPDCGKGPVRSAFECEGEAFGSHVRYRYAEHQECRYASAAVDGVTATARDRFLVEIGDLQLSLAENPRRLVVTRGQESVSIRECTMEGVEP